MAETVLVPIPVDPDVAEMLSDSRKRALAGAALGRFMRQREQLSDPLGMIIRKIQEQAVASGITDEEVEAELRAHKAERRR
jgi:hypothetical protein